MDVLLLPRKKIIAEGKIHSFTIVKIPAWHKNLIPIFILAPIPETFILGKLRGAGAMDKIQFNNLSVSDQACLLLDSGDLLATNCYYHYNVLLYNYENQFMELVYDNRAKQVLLVRVVNDNILQKYLDNIHLDLD